MSLKRKNSILILAIIAGVILITFFTTSIIIGRQVKKQCQIAQQEYPGEGGNCVEFLIDRVENENLSFEDRNKAIWALGQLGDPRALDTLNKYYTGKSKQKESLDQEISQRELEKAIKLCEGKVNITAFVWRNNLILGEYIDSKPSQ